MKARIKTTGEIVEVKDLYDDGTALVKDRYLKVSELNFFGDFETIDWEQRRYELAKAAMQGILGDEKEINFACFGAKYKENEIHTTVPKAVARYAVSCADALIEELKKGD
ncbi:hypothetical protein AAAY27_17550 [Bacteroides thetaiotaomicron]|jgi:hypothetical protein|uniref:hypothetical protein n=1 Tax=Bacteroidales TaxID=171549 RepID=UPI00104D466E|nr:MULTISPECIES: hypothetical protein [Bacteroidales]DAY52885.1 MAG TPA: hypothetical protein [Caudoviricetes sp.]MCS2244550.1 hypothetical protein [Bacteroides thetaiotaomicron]MCS2910064.1 hypothetical protein [Bacteroides thetaiotaomicron]MDC2097396.1 hypothetical protein [Bacteroides thetaiotaomicron]MDC2117925.1 hypothetical protein [Bacteroides thetaiotaomicron]